MAIFAKVHSEFKLKKMNIAQWFQNRKIICMTSSHNKYNGLQFLLQKYIEQITMTSSHDKYIFRHPRGKSIHPLGE